MALFPIGNLPLELLQKICLCLDKESLLSLSLTNKYCRNAAYSSLFETLRINVYNLQRLEREVQQWEVILSRCHAHKYVQNLIIAEGVSQEDQDDQSRTKRNIHWVLKGPDAVDLRGWDDHGWEVVSRYQPGRDTIARVPRAGTEDLTGWKDLACLCQHLPVLKAITYASYNHFPWDLQKLILSKRPDLCIHMKNILLELDPVLSERGQKRHYLGPGIAPHLRNITLCLDDIQDWIAADNKPKYIRRIYENLVALDKLMRNSANLKEIYVKWHIKSLNRIQQQAKELLGIDYIPTLEEVLQEDARAALTVLHIKSTEPIGSELMEYWMSRIDLGKLKNLKLELRHVKHSLIWLNANDPGLFTSLESLLLYNTTNSHRTLMEPEIPEILNQLTFFIRNLRPLVHIRLRTELSSSLLMALIDQHYSSLRQLWLDHESWEAGEFLVDTAIVEQLRIKCPRLEELRIPIQRTKGNDVEVNLYRTIGKIPSLRRLYLDMYPQKPYSSRYQTTSGFAFDPDWTEFDRREYELEERIEGDPKCFGDFTDAFVNVALDANLAQSIFELICSARGPTMIDLEILHLMPDPEYGFTLPTEVIDIMRNMARSYTFERDSRDTHRNEIFVRWYNEESLAKTNPSQSYSGLEDERLAQIFCNLWPQPEGATQRNYWWRTGWHSFALEVDKAEIDEAFRSAGKEKPVFTIQKDWKKPAS